MKRTSAILLLKCIVVIYKEIKRNTAFSYRCDYTIEKEGYEQVFLSILQVKKYAVTFLTCPST